MLTEAEPRWKPLPRHNLRQHGRYSSTAVVVVVVLRLHAVKVHPKPGPFHRLIWAMKPRQCIIVHVSDVHPVSQ